MSTNNTKFKVGDCVVTNPLPPQRRDSVVGLHGTICKIWDERGRDAYDIAYYTEPKDTFAWYYDDELEFCDDFDCWAKRVRQEHAGKVKV